MLEAALTPAGSCGLCCAQAVVGWRSGSMMQLDCQPPAAQPGGPQDAVDEAAGRMSSLCLLQQQVAFSSRAPEEASHIPQSCLCKAQSLSGHMWVGRRPLLGLYAACWTSLCSRAMLRQKMATARPRHPGA